MGPQNLSEFVLTPIPDGSDKFETIGGGRIRIHNNSDKYSIYVDMGVVHTGSHSIVIGNDSTYVELIVINGASLIVDNSMEVSDGRLEVHGKFELLKDSNLFVHNNGVVILHPDSVLIINDNVNVTVRDNSELTIYGRIDVHIDSINYILNAKNIIVDSAAVWNVHGISYTNRTFSLTDYEKDVRKTYINTYTQGEKNFPEGRLRYVWRQGNPTEPSHVLGISIEKGNVPLGDFRFPVLGRPISTTPSMQTISDLIIKEDATLYITESFNDFTYIRPELYLGMIINNTLTTANCDVYGKIVVDGKNGMITIDRGATLHIKEGAEVHLINDSIMKSTYNHGIPVLFIDGKLFIDDIEQISTFDPENIIFGANGKIIVLNPETEERRVLFSTPNGILSSDLYRLFLDRINNVEYHIPNNCGIAIDQYFEQYFRSLTDWYGGRRFEQAIYDGIIIFHEGAFIELDGTNIIPWVNEDTTLFQISRLFKSYATDDINRLQDVVNRLRFAGCSNIIFVLKYSDVVREIKMVLDDCTMKSIVNNPVSQRYRLKTNNGGMLFMINRTNSNDINRLISSRSKTFPIDDSCTLEFQL